MIIVILLGSDVIKRILKRIFLKSDEFNSSISAYSKAYDTDEIKPSSFGGVYDTLGICRDNCSYPLLNVKCSLFT